jgi:hypothetical protein
LIKGVIQMRTKKWPLARVVMSVVMLTVALPAYLHSQEALSPDPTSAAQARTRVDYYETPCQKREREERGVPVPPYTSEWIMERWDGTQATPELEDYWEAMRQCRANEPVAKWDWDNMVVVNVTYIGD